MVMMVGGLALGGKEGKEACFPHVDPHWVEETLASTCRFFEGKERFACNALLLLPLDPIGFADWAKVIYDLSRLHACYYCVTWY